MVNGGYFMVYKPSYNWGGPILYAGGICLGQGLRTGPFQRSQHALFAAHCTWEARDDLGLNHPWGDDHYIVGAETRILAIFHPSHIR